ncbi:uncharacterized protein LOC106175103 isoform X2 [Lingula anatina]|uniref:Uncharacterized protein LOC106175103 isoform X2 n=1 Tax=Lingula anatina TaxID=7574 RepID=A0A1S3JPV5_LINAN|nr:uncharacterized protein LOC106175103 isoform X2 [Lingula anatina]|eukprot:XP_013412387.1 uncharacterized protein LOC106175103 isoform X2 [Lingula anatina]
MSDMSDIMERTPKRPKRIITEVTESCSTNSTEITETYRSPRPARGDGESSSRYWREGWAGFDRMSRWQYPASVTSSSGINMSSSPEAQLLDLDYDLVRQLQTPDQIASMASSYVNQQVLLHSHCRLTTQEMDQIVRVMQDVAILDRDILLKFIVEYNKCLNQYASTTALHGPVIKLLLDVLLVSLDPVENVIVCLQLLSIFGQFTQNLTVMIECQVAATVMGVMAVHSRHALVQHHGCTILAYIATYQQLPNKKPAVGESGAELLLRAINGHKSNLDVVRPAIKALSNVTSNLTSVTTSSPAQVLGKEGQEHTAESEGLESCSGHLVIDYIQSFVLPVVEEMMLRHCYDPVVLGEGNKMRTALKSNSSSNSEEDGNYGGDGVNDDSKKWTFFKWKSKSDVKSSPSSNSGRIRIKPPVSPPKGTSTPSSVRKEQSDSVKKQEPDTWRDDFELRDLTTTPPREGKKPTLARLNSQNRACENNNASFQECGQSSVCLQPGTCYFSPTVQSPQSSVYTVSFKGASDFTAAAPYAVLNESVLSEDSLPPPKFKFKKKKSGPVSGCIKCLSFFPPIRWCLCSSVVR